MTTGSTGARGADDDRAETAERVLVVIPTYNEAENLTVIVDRVRRAVPAAEILVVDDASPDGTGAIADRLASADSQVHVLHRPGKRGLGAAYVAGFRWARERGFDVVVEMDADGSHAPEQLHLLLDQIDAGADLVIGARYVKGGKTVNWPWTRWILSKGGNLYISLALGAGLSDMTAGYRAYRRSLIEKFNLDELSNAGYIFQVDLAWRAVQAGADIREVPITFTERVIGESKLDGSFVKDSLLEVTRWGVAHRWNQLTTAVASLRKKLGK